jgi:hypothetical protein
MRVGKYWTTYNAPSRSWRNVRGVAVEGPVNDGGRLRLTFTAVDGAVLQVELTPAEASGLAAGMDRVRGAARFDSCNVMADGYAADSWPADVNDDGS